MRRGCILYICCIIWCWVGVEGSNVDIRVYPPDLITTNCSVCFNDGIDLGNASCFNPQQGLNAFRMSFVDPLPYRGPASQFRVRQFQLTYWGRYLCSFFSDYSTFHTAIDGEAACPGSNEHIQVGGKGCDCPQCGIPYSCNTTYYNHTMGWPGYEYRGNNTVNVLKLENNICLSYLDIRIIYDRIAYISLAEVDILYRDINGSLDIHLRTHGIDQHVAAECWFTFGNQSAVTALATIGRNRFSCPAPPPSPHYAYTLSIYYPSEDFRTNAIPLWIIPQPVITAASPSEVVLEVPFVLSLTLEGAIQDFMATHPSALVSCQFGRSFVSHGVVTNATHVSCVGKPPRKIRREVMTVAFKIHENQTWTYSDPAYSHGIVTFLPFPFILSYVPFNAFLGVDCALQMSAIFAPPNGSILDCTWGEGDIITPVSMDKGYMVCDIPTHSQGLAPGVVHYGLQLSDGSQHYRQYHKPVTLYPLPDLLSAHPRVIDTESTLEAVYVCGKGFANISTIGCVYSSELVISTGLYVNDSCVKCFLPSSLSVNVEIVITITYNPKVSSKRFLSATPIEDSHAKIILRKGDDDDDGVSFAWATTLFTTWWVYMIAAGIACFACAVCFSFVVFVVVTLVRRRRAYTRFMGYESLEIPEYLKELDMSSVKVGRRIGKGSFADVHVGVWRGTEVAVKKLPMEHLGEDFHDDFAREVALMRALRHPNVLQFLGACTHYPDICIIMELMPRGSLYRLLHSKTFEMGWEQAVQFALDSARGMNYLHCHDPPIVHRDLKSHNLLVDKSYSVKVCDFGLSKIQQQTLATMTACGTPCWTAPEVLRNQRYSAKADVYSFGIVMWELATRRDPYAGMPQFRVVFEVGTNLIRPPVPFDTPCDWADLMEQCWSEDPDDRPTFDQIIIALQEMSIPPGPIPYAPLVNPDGSAIDDLPPLRPSQPTVNE